VRKFFACALLLFALMYGAAELTLERPPADGVVRLRWATDPNPARNVQTEIFGKLQVRLKDSDVLDWDALARALAKPQAALARFAPLAASRGNTTDRPALLRAINEHLDRPDLFDGVDLSDLDLSHDARLLLKRKDDDEDLTNVEVAALNRRILEAALPRVIRKARRIEVTVESGAREKLLVQCATGIGPDIIDVYGKNQMMTYVSAGILVDLTPFAAKMGFGPEHTYPALTGGLVVDGRQWRFPCNVWANCVIYNRRIFDDHDVAYPKPGWTFDDFVAAGKRIVAGPGRSGEKHLAVAHFSPVWMYNDLLTGLGGRYFTPDGLASRLDGKEGLRAMKLYHDLMHVHKVIPTPAEAAAMSSQGGWATGAIAWFSSQRAAMILIGRWYLCQVVQYPETRKHLAAVQLPGIDGRASSGVTDARGAGINVNSPHRDDALKFIQYLAGRDYGQVIVNDGDSLPPNPNLARNGRDLVNDIVPDPNFHQPFVDAVGPARPLDASPFIDGEQIDRWVLETLQKVENRLLGPEDAVRALAAEINRRIRTNLRRRIDLQRKFEQVTGRKYSDDWQRPR